MVRGGGSRGSGKERWEAGRMALRHGLAIVSWGGDMREMAYGRKLQAEFGRCETSVKISEISRC